MATMSPAAPRTATDPGTPRTAGRGQGSLVRGVPWSGKAGGAWGAVGNGEGPLGSLWAHLAQRNSGKKCLKRTQK